MKEFNGLKQDAIKSLDIHNKQKQDILSLDEKPRKKTIFSSFKSRFQDISFSAHMDFSQSIMKKSSSFCENKNEEDSSQRFQEIISKEKEISCKDNPSDIKSSMSQISKHIFDEIKEENIYLKRILKLKQNKIKLLNEKLASFQNEIDTMKKENEKTKNQIKNIELELFQNKEIKQIEIKRNEKYFKEKNIDECPDNSQIQNDPNVVLLSKDKISQSCLKNKPNTINFDEFQLNLYWNLQSMAKFNFDSNIIDMRIELDPVKENQYFENIELSLKETTQSN